ncbi:hydroxyisourate hydrolase [Mycolicibacterium sp. CH28]|jgi:5-hydroxyisourate hydrolase|uniref:hydroxyisourate hydrolase n=1 Tax=Mycolicibacterium sp. CH28 TaxID=2512237 RepID=UPI001081C24C|nr:hydroxyisourate hydrolase [Mycolicibacterium sp. CH28]TGD86817.1 hydroxyisourate hydrolase [Mycolicibacterium sp. CH28]
MAQLSTHVLDAAVGRPAAGIAVTLLGPDDATVATGVTDVDGRASFGSQLPEGVYRLQFATAGYFDARGVASFYPEVVIAFHVADSVGKYHVPLLLSPFAYSTYRGS